MTLDELHALLDPAVQALIGAHANEEPAAFAMRFHGRKELPVRAMAEQIACRRKAAQKLPSLSRHPLLYTLLSLEQASGERAAEWKSGLLEGDRLLDLTGGLGIDDLFLARRFGQVVACERDEVLAGISIFNREVMRIPNVETMVGESAGLLGEFPDDSFDWVYVDPARREGARRSVALEESSPNVVALHDLMLAKARRICIKASPALEVKGLPEKLPSLVEVIVVSVDGECKEVLLLLDRNRESAGSRIRAVCLGEVPFDIARDPAGGSEQCVVASRVGGWLYEPDPAIIKARLTAELASMLTLEFLNGSVDYLTSDRFVDQFPGRSFAVVDLFPFKPKSFRGELDRLGVTAASVQRRDFPLSPEEIRKRFRIAEGSRFYLFFTRDGSGSLVCVVCRKP